VFGERDSGQGKGGNETKLEEESEGQGAGRLFVAKGRGTHKTPSPRKLTSYSVHLDFKGVG
jgi:hypothetical protein